MSRRTYFPSLLTLLVCIVGIVPTPAGAAEKQSYVVVLEDSVQAPAHVARSQTEERGGEIGFVYRHAIKGYSAELPEQALEGLRRDPRVKYVLEDGPVKAVEDIEIETDDNESVEPLAATVPTGISRTYAASNKALDIDEQDDTRAEVDVAVLDSGISPTHPDLRVVGRVDCTKGGETCISNSGSGESHGTHVAGTIGALDNGFGVVGVAPGARLWSVKVLSGGYGEWSWVLAGADWVAGHSGDIEVANLSLGGPLTFFAVQQALEKTTEEGVVFTVAAGNRGINAAQFHPANVTPLLTVSAIADYDGKPGGEASPTCGNGEYGLDDQLASFSNWGAVDIAAPGVCILSTEVANGYSVKTGTSMAAPHVAGAAAILAAKDNPNSTKDVQDIQYTLITTGNWVWTDTSGDGVKEPLLDVRKESVYSLVEAPTVTTGPASVVGVGAEAKPLLTGSIDPNGLSTTYQFEYVPASKYKPEAENPYAEGTKAPLSPAGIGSGNKGQDLEVKEALSGLEPNTTYHYRLVAENSEGVVRGGDQTFVSLPACQGTEGKCEWSLQSTPNPQPETNSVLKDVSCPSSSMCMAVGSDNYRERGFAEHWNGSEWKLSNDLPTAMKAVSCPTSTWCMALGLEGKAWQLKWSKNLFTGIWSWSQSAANLPTPEGGTGVQLADVSCTAESACTAVGSYSVGGTPKPYVARWSGSSWSLQSAPSPSEGNGSEAMLSVSCASSTFCVTAGKAASKPIIQRWNGSEWAIQSAPAPEGATETTLQGIACASESACMAVGSFRGSGLNAKPVAERWDGSKWSVVTTPALAKEGRAALRSVSCLSASSCIAVGSLASPALTPEAETTLVESWNGTAWTLQSSPNPEGKAFSSFAGVSCTSAVECTAVGHAQGGGATSVTLAERWNGENWSLQSTPNPQPETNSVLKDVSCPSSSMCMAVGSDNYRERGFAEHWDGSEWRVSNNFVGTMKAVSCPVSTWCMAITPEGKAWLLKWVKSIFSGSWSWSQAATSLPTPEGGSSVQSHDISCTSESACTVVGRYSVGGTPKPYVARWNGSSWSLQSAPGPSEGSAGEAMLSVSCASSTFCVAVGKANKNPFVERWNGSEWTIQSAPAPEGTTESTLEGISCTSESACMAVGKFNSGGFMATKPLTERWDGSKWSVVTTPALAKEGRAALRSVSCLSASSCIAAGSLASPALVPEVETTLVENWNGTEWTIQSSPNPEGKSFSSFAGVSCTSAVECTAVGHAQGGGATSVTLAERWR